MNSIIKDNIRRDFREFLEEHNQFSRSYDYNYLCDDDGDEIAVYAGITIQVFRKHSVLFEDEYGREETAELLDHLTAGLTYIEVWVDDNLDTRLSDDIRNILEETITEFENGK